MHLIINPGFFSIFICYLIHILLKRISIQVYCKSESSAAICMAIKNSFRTSVQNRNIYSSEIYLFKSKVFSQTTFPLHVYSNHVVLFSFWLHRWAAQYLGVWNRFMVFEYIFSLCLASTCYRLTVQCKM